MIWWRLPATGEVFSELETWEMFGPPEAGESAWSYMTRLGEWRDVNLIPQLTEER